jgi:hypothetical protein
VASPDAADTSQSTVTADAGAPQVPVRVTRLLLDFTIVTQNGRYAPRNVGVAWVADEQGRWVHTLELWCGDHFTYVFQTYSMAGGPPYRSDLAPQIPDPPTPPDVISSGTLFMPGPHTRDSWSLMDASGNPVPYGNYSIVIEVAEQDPEIVNVFPFVYAGVPGEETPAATSSVQNVRIRLE